MAWVVVTYAEERHCPNCGTTWLDRSSAIFPAACPACSQEFEASSGWLSIDPVVVAFVTRQPDRGLY